jgi:hypothetical protein
MNIIRAIYAGLESAVYSINPVIVQFCIQMALLLAVPIAFCALAFGRGWRFVPLQITLAIVGMLTAMSIPVEKWELESAVARLWLTVVSILAVIFLPPLLSYLTCPAFGKQRTVTLVIYVTISVLSICQLCRVF